MKPRSKLDQTFHRVLLEFGERVLEKRCLLFGVSPQHLKIYSTIGDVEDLFLDLTQTEKGYYRTLANGTKRKVENPERVIREFLQEGYSKLQRIFDQDFDLDPNARISEERKEIRTRFDTLTNILESMGYLVFSMNTTSSGLPRVISLRGPYKKVIERDFRDASRLAGFCDKKYSLGHSHISMDYKESVRKRMRGAA
jgi:hypothetical protein